VAPSVGIGEAGVGVVPRGGGPEGCPGVSVLLLADGSYEQVACAVRSLSWQQLPWPWTLELRVAAATRGVFEAVASVPDPRLRVFQFAGGTTPATMRSVLLGPSRGALVAWIGPLELLRPDGLWGLMAGLEQLGELGLVVCGHEESDGALRVRRPWARRGTSPAGPVLADRVVLDAVGALQGPELMRRAMAAGYAAGWVDGALVLRTPAGGGAMADEPTGTGDSSSLIKRTAFFTAGGTRVERLGWVEAGGAMTEEDVAGDW